MANPYVNLNHVAKITLHEGWLEHKSFYEHKYKKSWLTLQGSALCFFNSQNTSSESPTAVLKIDGGFKFIKKERGSEKAGYKFELHTSHSITKFKACKFSERELWRAYLEGIATGQVSDKLDLPPEILVQIRLLLQAQYINNGFVDPGESTDSVQATPPFDEDGLNYTIDSVSADSGCVDDFYQEPANYHLLNYVFYNDHCKRELPSWFFQNCSRDMAEDILTKGFSFGNTLMRKGSSNTSNLVISKKMEARKDEFCHFVTEILPDGYKLKVENPHQPMKCLTDVMAFFVQTSGASTTKPMTCNNLQKIGISPDHVYNPVIVQNPTRKSVAIREDSPGFPNTPSRNDKAKAWMKNRSQSIPNITPLMDLRQDVRRLSVSIEADKSPTSNIPKAKFLVPSQHPQPQDIPAPPPPPPPSSSPPKLRNSSDWPKSRMNAVNSPPLSLPPPLPSSNAPPLPDNYPSPRKSQTGSTLSLAAKFDDFALKKNTPPVAPKPVKKSVEDSQNVKKIGDASLTMKQVHPNTEENSEVIYAKIMKKKTPLNQSKSVPLSYENWKTMMEENEMNNTKERLSSLNDAKLTYAEINPGPYMLYQDLKEANYEPVNLKEFHDGNLSKPKTCQRNMEEEEIDEKCSYETYELTESVFEDRPGNKVITIAEGESPKNKNNIQEFKYLVEDCSSEKRLNGRKSNTNSNGVYEPICDNYRPKRRGSLDILSIDSNPNNIKCTRNITDKIKTVENEYETIHSVDKKILPPATKPRTIIGISSPGEIYHENVDWKSKVNRPRIPSPKPRRRTNSLTWKTEKFYDDTNTAKKSSTLNALDDLKSEFKFLDDKYYDEVLSNGMANKEQIKTVSNYVDVIADYEDIKAAKISQKLLASRKHSVPEDDFRKRLEMMFGDKSKTMPAIRQPNSNRPLPNKPDLKTVVTATNSFPATSQTSIDVVYDDLDGYQNLGATKKW